ELLLLELRLAGRRLAAEARGAVGFESHAPSDQETATSSPKCRPSARRYVSSVLPWPSTNRATKRKSGFFTSPCSVSARRLPAPSGPRSYVQVPPSGRR